MIRPGLIFHRSSGPSPHFSSVPGTKFSTSMSAFSISASNSFAPSSVRKFSEKLFFDRPYSFHHTCPSPKSRRSSPVSGRSILITSAPKSTSIRVTILPAARRVISTIRTPVSAPSESGWYWPFCMVFPLWRAACGTNREFIEW